MLVLRVTGPEAVTVPPRGEKGVFKLVVHQTWYVLPETLFQLKTVLPCMAKMGIQPGFTNVTPKLLALGAPWIPARLTTLTVA